MVHSFFSPHSAPPPPPPQNSSISSECTNIKNDESEKSIKFLHCCSRHCFPFEFCLVAQKWSLKDHKNQGKSKGQISMSCASGGSHQKQVNSQHDNGVMIASTEDDKHEPIFNGLCRLTFYDESSSTWIFNFDLRAHLSRWVSPCLTKCPRTIKTSSYLFPYV